MKTKLLTLALFGLLTLGFVSCADEEIAPSNEIELNEKSSGGIGNPKLERDR